MSLVTNVLRQAHGLSHAARLVLLGISAHIEENGIPAYPSQSTLAKDTGVTERYIEACVQECELAGYLQVERLREPGKRPRNIYVVSLPTSAPSPEQLRPQRKKHSNYAKTFLMIGRRDGFHCQHCRSTVDLQIDHIISVIKGGTNALPNLQLLCQPCNGKKGTL